MKITLRGSVYVADLRELGAGRVSLKTRDYAVAKRRYVAAVADIQLLAKVTTPAKVNKPPKETKPTKPTKVLTLESAYRDCHTEGDWADAKDKRSIFTRWKMVQEFFGKTTPLIDITRKRMSEFVKWMRGQQNGNGDQRYTPKTINRHLALVSKIARNAAENELIPAMPLVPWLKVPRSGGVRWYTHEEEEQILGWFATHAHPEMVTLSEFLFDSGFRRGEAIGPYRVVGDCAVLDDQKGGAGKQTSTPLTKRALRAAKAKPWVDLSASILNKRWEKMRNALGLGSKATMHACRHTTATRLALAGVPLREVQKFMRHSCETTTLIYIHLASEMMQGAVDVLEKCAKSAPNSEPNAGSSWHS